MFQPATWIQGRVKPSCRSGLDLSNRVSIQMDRPKVTSDGEPAPSSAGRSSCPDGMKSRTSTPTSGKKVTRIRGLVIKFMFTPRSCQCHMSNVKDMTPDVRLLELFQQQIAKNNDNTEQDRQRIDCAQNRSAGGADRPETRRVRLPRPLAMASMNCWSTRRSSTVLESQLYVPAMTLSWNQSCQKRHRSRPPGSGRCPHSG